MFKKSLARVLLLLFLVVVIGCGGAPAPAATPDTAALDVANAAAATAEAKLAEAEAEMAEAAAETALLNHRERLFSLTTAPWNLTRRQPITWSVSKKPIPR